MVWRITRHTSKRGKGIAVEEETITKQPVKVMVAGREFDLKVVEAALNWASDLVTGIDVMNAAKNCAEIRYSPIWEEINEALAVLEEMRAYVTHLEDQGHGQHDLQQN